MLRMNIHRGPFIQRGRGLGSLLSSLFKSVIPVASRVGKKIISSPITSNALKATKDAAIEGGLQIAVDALKGKSMEETMQHQLESAKKKVSKALEKGIKQRKALKRKTNMKHLKDDSKKFKGKRRKKEKTKRDIFDE